MKKVSERTIRTTIAMMRTIADGTIKWPFIKECAKDMEQMLDELIELRKQNALRN
jgi:hypothetical protein